MSAVARGARPRTGTAAEVLASFCSEIRWSRVPTDVRERVMELVLDHIGVVLGGRDAASTQAMHRFVRDLAAPGRATVLGASVATEASWAALANGTAAHATEMDDVTTESSLHPGAPVIPAALALAEQHEITAARFLEAVVAGYEVTMRVGNALGAASSYQRGFHPTGVAGAFGAAMAAGLVLELDDAGLVRALGIAGTMASGSLEYLAHGSWTKRLNPGWAAHSGVVAASLAREGFTAPASVFEGRSGLLRGYTDEPRPERLTADLGDPLLVMRVSIKPYACCRYNHGLIDGVLQLKREHRIAPEEVDRIRLSVLSGGALLVAEPIEQKREPRNVVDAQFSAPFAAAVALVRDAAGVAEYTQETVDDPRVRALMARTDCDRDASLDAAYPQSWPAAVELRLRDGRVLQTRVDHATGEPERPVAREALVEKFIALSSPVLGTSARRIAERILALDAEPAMAGVTAALRG